MRFFGSGNRQKAASGVSSPTMFKRTPSPTSLVAWSMGGALLMASPWLLFVAHIRPAPLIWRALVLLPPFVIGLAVSFRARHRLKAGMQAEVWEEGQLAPIRSVLSNPFWMWVNLFVLAAFMSSFVLLSHQRGARVFFWILYFPLTTMMDLRRLVAPSPERNGLSLNFQKAEPLQSDHWGKPDPLPRESLHS
jgi:hypothetical protein